MAKGTKIKVQDQIKRGIISSEVSGFSKSTHLSQLPSKCNSGNRLEAPVGPAAASMFHDDGTMRKCVKADLAHGLEDGVNSSVDSNTKKDLSVIIRDSMAIIQATRTSDVNPI